MYVQFRSKTLLETMEKLEKILKEDTKDVPGIRTLGMYVRNHNIKTLMTSKACCYQWFKQKLPELEPYQDTYKDDYMAFENAMERLKAMTPDVWTISDMFEEGGRMLNELKSIDGLYQTLVERRSTVIDQRREAMKDSLKIKHKQAIVTMKMAKPWIENGANKKLMVILMKIGACCAFCYFIKSYFDIVWGLSICWSVVVV